MNDLPIHGQTPMMSMTMEGLRAYAANKDLGRRTSILLRSLALQNSMSNRGLQSNMRLQLESAMQRRQRQLTL